MQYKKCRVCEEIKPFDGFSKRTSSKDGHMNICKLCDSQKSSKWHFDNPEKSKTRGAKYRENNKEYVLQRDRNKYYKGREIILEKRKEYYENNKYFVIKRVLNYQKENREVNRRAQRRHYTNHKHQYIARSSYRRSSKLQATPRWLTEIHKMQIQWYYSAAKMMTETSGVKHHVDHIHPLKGNGFTGLHVPWNLRVIKAEENISKSNKIPQELKNLAWEIEYAA